MMKYVALGAAGVVLSVKAHDMLMKEDYSSVEMKHILMIAGIWAIGASAYFYFVE
jgi:hypothetical protein